MMWEGKITVPESANPSFDGHMIIINGLFWGRWTALVMTLTPGGKHSKCDN